LQPSFLELSEYRRPDEINPWGTERWAKLFCEVAGRTKGDLTLQLGALLTPPEALAMGLLHEMVGANGQRSPRHTMPLNSRYEGAKCVG
jgi:hypothetical protein